MTDVKLIEVVDKSEKNGIIKLKEVKELEQAKKRDHKIYVTDIAIEKVDKICLSDFTEEQASVMQHKHKELLKYAKENNNSNEVLLINDVNFTGEVVVKGTEFVCSPGDNPFAVSVVAHAEKYSLIYMHNHPSTNSFSISDIDTFVTESAIKTMSVVTNQGEVYILNKLSDYNYNKTRMLLYEIFHSFGTQAVENREFVNKFLKRCNEGGIEYAKSK